MSSKFITLPQKINRNGKKSKGFSVKINQIDPTTGSVKDSFVRLVWIPISLIKDGCVARWIVEKRVEELFDAELRLFRYSTPLLSLDFGGENFTSS